MKCRTIVACAVLVISGGLLPAWAQEESVEGPEQVLKMVEGIASGKGRIKMADEKWSAELNRLQARASKAVLEVNVLEALLAKKRAEAQAAQADLKLFEITHSPTGQ